MQTKLTLGTMAQVGDGAERRMRFVPNPSHRVARTFANETEYLAWRTVNGTSKVKANDAQATTPDQPTKAKGPKRRKRKQSPQRLTMVTSSDAFWHRATVQTGRTVRSPAEGGKRTKHCQGHLTAQPSNKGLGNYRDFLTALCMPAGRQEALEKQKKADAKWIKQSRKGLRKVRQKRTKHYTPEWRT